jgi:cell division transport system permease protein
MMGGALGFSFAAFVILLIGLRLSATGSDLLGAVGLDTRGWLLLVALPVFSVALATLTARWTVLRALGRAL